MALSRDIAARLATEEELRESREALNEAERVLAVADDRDRIARDLHDSVIQRLSGAGLSLQAVASLALWSPLPPCAAPRRPDQGTSARCHGLGVSPGRWRTT